MSDIKRVLLTGSNGYIGCVMGPLLQDMGYDVVGLDVGYFDPCTLFARRDSIPVIEKDIRDIEPADLAGYDAVVHLAALSNDPIGNLNEAWTREINGDGTIRLAECAKAAGVKRFLFSSSCIMYGMSSVSVVNEESPLAPQTQYARSKVDAETKLREMADEGFSPVYCRNGTIYGLSACMRFDTVLNNLMGSACVTGRVVIHSDGTPWRPVVHVQDVARAFEQMLRAPVDLIHNQAFNIGANHLNHQIRELGEIVERTVPNCELSFVRQAGADQRTYKADFGKFEKAFPDFEFLWNAEKGAQELFKAFRQVNLTADDFTGKRFTRLKWLQDLLDEGMLDDDLRWSEKSDTVPPNPVEAQREPARSVV